MTAPMSAEEVMAVLQAAAWTLSERGCTIDEFESARTAVAAMAEREAEAVRRLEMLGQAILDAAHRAGIVRADVSADGPTLMMLCEDLATSASSAISLVTEVEALRAIPEQIAKGWDGCYYDDGLSEGTIGDRIRHDASRLIDTARAGARDV